MKLNFLSIFFRSFVEKKNSFFLFVLELLLIICPMNTHTHKIALSLFYCQEIIDLPSESFKFFFKKTKNTSKKKKLDFFKIIVQKIIFNILAEIPKKIFLFSDFSSSKFSFFLKFLKIQADLLRFISFIFLNKISKGIFSEKSEQKNSIFFTRKLSNLFQRKLYKDIVEELRIFSTLDFFFSLYNNKSKGNFNLKRINFWPSFKISSRSEKYFKLKLKTLTKKILGRHNPDKGNEIVQKKFFSKKIFKPFLVKIFLEKNFNERVSELSTLKLLRMGKNFKKKGGGNFFLNFSELIKIKSKKISKIFFRKIQIFLAKFQEEDNFAIMKNAFLVDSWAKMNNIEEKLMQTKLFLRNFFETRPKNIAYILEVLFVIEKNCFRYAFIYFFLSFRFRFYSFKKFINENVCLNLKKSLNKKKVLFKRPFKHFGIQEFMRKRKCQSKIYFEKIFDENLIVIYNEKKDFLPIKLNSFIFQQFFSLSFNFAPFFFKRKLINVGWVKIKTREARNLIMVFFECLEFFIKFNKRKDRIFFSNLFLKRLKNLYFQNSYILFFVMKRFCLKNQKISLFFSFLFLFLLLKKKYKNFVDENKKRYNIQCLVFFLKIWIMNKFFKKKKFKKKKICQKICQKKLNNIIRIIKENFIYYKNQRSFLGRIVNLDSFNIFPSIRGRKFSSTKRLKIYFNFFDYFFFGKDALNGVKKKNLYFFLSKNYIFLHPISSILVLELDEKKILTCKKRIDRKGKFSLKSWLKNFRVEIPLQTCFSSFLFLTKLINFLKNKKRF